MRPNFSPRPVKAVRMPVIILVMDPKNGILVNMRGGTLMRLVTHVRALNRIRRCAQEAAHFFFLKKKGTCLDIFSDVHVIAVDALTGRCN